LPRLKTQPNLRQSYREAVERANNIGINAELARGYLYFTNISDPEHIAEEELWANARNLDKFIKVVNLAETIVSEREGVIAALKEIEIFAQSKGIKFGPLNENAWYFYYETVNDKIFLPFTKVSKGRVYALILGVK